jgi:hypothetical protein
MTTQLRSLLLTGSVAALVLVLPVAMTASPGASGAAHVIQRVPSVPAPAPPEPGSRDPLDAIRMDAMQGNVDASAELAQRLIDRFEQTGNQENLYEAFQWIARDWDQREFLRTDVIQRAVAHHCDGPVLRWHWLCVAGE